MSGVFDDALEKRYAKQPEIALEKGSRTRNPLIWLASPIWTPFTYALINKLYGGASRDHLRYHYFRRLLGLHARQ